MKFIKYLSILSGTFVTVIFLALTFGLIKFYSAINPIISGLIILGFSISIILNQLNHTKVKWIAFSFSILGLSILLLSIFQIILLKAFWQYGASSLSIAILIGLYNQIQSVSISKGKYFFIGLILTIFMMITLLAMTLKIENPTVYYVGKITLILFSIFVVIGSILKLKRPTN